MAKKSIEKSSTIEHKVPEPLEKIDDRLIAATARDMEAVSLNGSSEEEVIL